MSFLLHLYRPLLGWLFGLTILVSSIFGNYIITLLLPLVYCGKHVEWRAYMDRAISFWMFVPIATLEYVFGVRYRVTGDAIDPDQPAIVIMNHRTRLDWMYYWSALFHQNPWLITTSKISLKAELKSLPGAGFGMAAAQFVFLERDMQKDMDSFDRAIKYYKGMNRNYQLLLFPEGTDKSPWTTRKSAAYAAQHGLPQLKHLIHPRVAGFHHLLTIMRRAQYISNVYDVTVAYPYDVVQSEVDLVLKGKAPSEVHFHIEKIPVGDLPKDKEDLEKWLRKLWLMKDDRLASYHSEERCSDKQFIPTSTQHEWSTRRESVKHTFIKMFALVFWVSVICTWIYHLTFIGALQIGLAYFFLTSFTMSYYFGGIDAFVYGRWSRSVKTSVV